ncbi:SRF-like protein, partial [Testicularia cyperi]
MGRKKIKIQPIKEDRNRSVTYLKRKAGLFKKAHELAVLTDSQVAVIVFGHNGKLAEFCSTDIDLLLLRYTEYDGIAEKKGPQHYFGLDKDSDDDNDDETGDPDDANNNNHHNGNNGFGPSDAN